MCSCVYKYLVSTHTVGRIETAIAESIEQLPGSLQDDKMPPGVEGWLAARRRAFTKADRWAAHTVLSPRVVEFEAKETRDWNVHEED